MSNELNLKPPGRLPDGKINPQYNLWYRKYRLDKEKKNSKAREKRGNPKKLIDDPEKPRSTINGAANPDYYKWYRSRDEHKQKKNAKAKAKRMRRTNPIYIEKCKKNAERAFADKKPEWEKARLNGVKNSQKVKDAIKATARRFRDVITEKWRNNPKFQHGPEHCSAVNWQVRSPRGKTYFFKNLSYFIDMHQELFDAADVDFSKGFVKCRAYGGINSIKPYTKDGSPARRKVNSQWKGWQWVWEKNQSL